MSEFEEMILRCVQVLGSASTVNLAVSLGQHKDRLIPVSEIEAAVDKLLHSGYLVCQTNIRERKSQYELTIKSRDHLAARG